MGIDEGTARSWSLSMAQPLLDPHSFTFSFFLSGLFSFPGPSWWPDRRTYRGTDTPRWQETLTYKGTSRWSLLTIIIPILRTRTQLSLGCGMLNSPIAYRTTCTNTMENGLRPNFCGISLFLNFSFLNIFINCIRTLWYALIHQGLHYAPYYGNKVQTLFTIQFGTPNLYASALNHVFGQ